MSLADNPSPSPDGPTAPVPSPQFRPVWSSDLKPADGDVPWLWDGYLAPRNITLLISQWKSGKTTLLSALLARRAAGGTFAGRAIKPGRTAVLCEEDEEHWRQRRRTLDFGGGVAFFFRPIACRKPSAAEWRALIESMAGLQASHGVDLAVIDPLAAFFPGAENQAAPALEALMPLERLQSLGMAVLILHHPSKGYTLEGQSGRGSGAVMGYVDIQIEMRHYTSAADSDRRRVLQTWSRFPTTPKQLVIEWNADGSDYLTLGGVSDEEFREHWAGLLPLFESAPDKLTRRELRGLLPHGKGTPSEATLWRWLERAVAGGVLLREGNGHKNAPFRYWLPARETEWMKDPTYRLMRQDEEARAQVDRLRLSPPEAG
ncbi:MAG TPA: AAA family ATPase [Gemmataceae bacterium]|nr:AAA family ATPase [Gemmataceae bacterium]